MMHDTGTDDVAAGERMCNGLQKRSRTSSGNGRAAAMTALNSSSDKRTGGMVESSPCAPQRRA
jgi:hypothetical protein